MNINGPWRGWLPVSLACPKLGVLDTLVILSLGGTGDTPPLEGWGDVPPPWDDAFRNLGECPGVLGEPPGVTLGELCCEREKFLLSDGELGGRGGGSLRLNSDTTLVLEYIN